jgi:hypothetical protein
MGLAPTRLGKLGNINMRSFFILLTVASGLAGLSGCTSTGDSAAALYAMNNPPNSCGSGGTNDINACASNHR